MNPERPHRRTKIVATLGPASLRPDVLAAMLRAGMDVARLNTSHSTIEEHVRAAKLVREVAAAEGCYIAVLMDLGGPKLRTGSLEGDPLPLAAGDEVRLVAGAGPAAPGRITVNYPRLAEDVQPGQRVLIDDGSIELVVEEVTGGTLVCRVVEGGELGSRKGVSLPGAVLALPALTDRDREAIAAGVEAGVDYFGLSFVSGAEDILTARDAIRAHGGSTPIIAKIERAQAIENLDAILAEADGAMVARGDLGVDLAPEEVPVQQRRIIASAAKHMVPVITATQMLESMTHSPRPTRAESSDVANATWDLSDALMLSGETAIGRYPVAAVAMMDRIIARAEETALPPPDAPFMTQSHSHSYVVALAARRILETDEHMRAVVCLTRSGYTALLLSKVHPRTAIFAISADEAVCRRLALARSVIPLLGNPLSESSEERLGMVDRLLLEGHYLSRGDEVVVLGSMFAPEGTTNFLKLHHVGEMAGA